MKTYVVRPYFGHDCDSKQGFNNGHYLNEIVVDAADESEAIDKAMNEVAATFLTNPADWERDGDFGDCTLYSEFDHVYVTDDGTEYTDESDIPLGDESTAIEPQSGNWAQDYETHYRYQYIDFSDVAEVAAEKAGAK